MEVMMPLSSSAMTGDNLMFSRSTCTSPCAPQNASNNYFFSAPSSPTNSSPFSRQITFALDAIANNQQSDDNNGRHHQSGGHTDEDVAVDSANLDHSIAKKYFSFNFYVTDDQDDGDEDSKTKEEDSEFDFQAAAADQDDGTTKEDFTFDFSGLLVESSMPPVNHQVFRGGLINSTVEPAAPKKTLQNAVSFRQRKKYSDPCAKSRERAGNSSNYMDGRQQKSPKAVSMVSERVNNTKKSCKAPPSSPRTEASSEQVISMERSSSSSTSWLIKWKLPDLLFRSASEGHETKKKLYEIEGKNIMNENVKMSAGTGGSRKKKERVSGHDELHYYKANRAAAAETRKKTFLPYKQNLMGCKSLDSLIVLEPSVRGKSSIVPK